MEHNLPNDVMEWPEYLTGILKQMEGEFKTRYPEGYEKGPGVVTDFDNTVVRLLEAKISHWRHNGEWVLH